MKALIGTKRGMTQIWREDGTRVTVTVIDVAPNVVSAVRTVERDGYAAVQLALGEVRPKCLSKPQLGQYSKAGIEPRRWQREVRGLDGEHEVGATVTVEAFEAGQLVDVVGTSKGKGFAGTVKLHHFNRGPTSHGTENIRKPGSIGMHTQPGRTIKGKRMARRMGHERVTVKNLEVVAVDAENHRLLIKGAVPGNAGGLVLVRSAGAGRNGGA